MNNDDIIVKGIKPEIINCDIFVQGIKPETINNNILQEHKPQITNSTFLNSNRTNMLTQYSQNDNDTEEDLEEEQEDDEYHEKSEFERRIENLKKDCNYRHTFKEQYITQNVEYELYSYNQCEEIPVNIMVDDIVLDCPNGEEDMSYFIWDWKFKDKLLTVVFDSTNIPTYSVHHNNNIISVFEDHSYNFQSGDGYTSAYITKNNHFVIDNIGDVSSLVILKYSDNI